MVVISLVIVHDAHPYIIVGVIVALKRWSLDPSGYVVLVNSCRSEWNLRQLPRCDYEVEKSKQPAA